MKYKYLILLCLFFAGVQSCKEGEADIKNPFETQNPPDGHDQVDGEDAEVDPNTIEGLHKNIFRYNCANSGCHDGNFEPDFRTVESSYNTMVNQPIIKNDELNPLASRVVPGKADMSMLVKRLKVDLNGNSGIMPLVVEPGSDWNDKKEEYIQNIENWINNGALDQDSVARGDVDFPPQLHGMCAVVGGNTIARSRGYNPLIIPAGATSAEIWFAFKDDFTDLSAMSGLESNYSIHFESFDSLGWGNLSYQSTPITANGFFEEDVDHHFKLTIDLTTWNPDDVIWIRTKINDGKNAIELPNDDSHFNTKSYCSIKLR